jgi:hypothetical protein
MILRSGRTCSKPAPRAAAWLWGALSFLVACSASRSDPPENPDLDTALWISHAALKPVLLTGEPVTRDIAIGVPAWMEIQGSTLWLTDRLGDPFVHVVDLRTGRVLVSFGRSGAGPGDFQAVTNMSVRPHDESAVWVFDANLGRITRVGEGPVVSPAIIRQPSGELIERMLWVSHDRLLAINHSDTARYVVVDTTSHILGRIPANLLGSDSLPRSQRIAHSTGLVVCSNPESDRLAILYVHGGRIDIHDLTGQFIRRSAVPFPSNGGLQRDSAGKLYWHDVRDYYVSCGTSNRHLFALFSGVRLKRPGGAGTIVAEMVHEFDWDGRFVGAYRLDRLTTAIVAQSDSVLYGAASDASGIFRYRIPARTKQ